VYVQIGGGAEALNEGDGAGARFAAFDAGLPDQMRRDHPVDDLLGFFCGALNLVLALVTERNRVSHAGTAIAFVNVGTFSGAALLQSLVGALAASAGIRSGILVMSVAAAIALAVSLMFWARAVDMAESTAPAG
jgi:hypothetical protein